MRSRPRPNRRAAALLPPCHRVRRRTAQRRFLGRFNRRSKSDPPERYAPQPGLYQVASGPEKVGRSAATPAARMRRFTPSSRKTRTWTLCWTASRITFNPCRETRTVSSTAMTGTNALAMIRYRLRPCIAAMLAAVVVGCTTTAAPPRDAISLWQMLVEIGSSADGALSQVRDWVPDGEVEVLGLYVHRAAPFMTTDGYEVEGMIFNLDRQKEVRAYSLNLSRGGCMPLDAVPGFDRAELRPTPVYVSGPRVKKSPRDWRIELPQAWLYLVPQAEDDQCVARVRVSARRKR